MGLAEGRAIRIIAKRQRPAPEVRPARQGATQVANPLPKKKNPKNGFGGRERIRTSGCFHNTTFPRSHIRPL